jgi:CubicO group peptidase (beta-lactamase class C family)
MSSLRANLPGFFTQKPVAFAAVVFAMLLIGVCPPTQAEPDEELLGKSLNYPSGNAATWYNNPNRVGAWSALDKVPGVRVRLVERPPSVRVLPVAASAAQISYRYKNVSYTLADYLGRQRVTGLLVLKNGEIVAEHYRYGRKDDARFLSFSMAKSVTSLLLGQAQALGSIRSLDDTAEQYVKELAGSTYGATTIHQLLRMSSGLTFTERYDGTDDLTRLARASAGAAGAGKPVDVLRSITERHSEAGEKFVYASAETDVLGRILTAATGKNMSELTREWLWKPMGAEHDAFWRVSSDGQEQSFGGFNASLRDWGRLGLLLANDGRVETIHVNGKTETQQVLPREYLLDATDPARQPAAFKPRKATPYFGYGYQFWLMPFKERTFTMQGIHGQAVYVQPSSGIVLVLTSVWESASGKQNAQPYEERDALWRGVLQTLGGSQTAQSTN